MFIFLMGILHYIPLRKDENGNIGYEVKTGDSFLRSEYGSPALAIVDGKAKLFCIKGPNNP